MTFELLCKAMNYIPFSEWEFMGITDTEEYGDSNCACGHEIRYEYIFTHNHHQLIVGSKCQKLFRNPTLGLDVRKIKKDTTKSISESNITIIFNKKIITPWEYSFYVDTQRKRKLSPKQLYHRQRINKKILHDYVLSEVIIND